MDTRQVAAQRGATEKRLVYATVPDGILVFDTDDNWKLVRRIPAWKRGNVRGLAASPAHGLLYVALTEVYAFDLATDKLVWQNNYDKHCCDRLALSPDEKTLYIPGRDRWNVADAATGKLIATIPVPDMGDLQRPGGPHNTIVSSDGRLVFMSGNRTNVTVVADTTTNKIVQRITFGDVHTRPFTINSRGTLLFQNMTGLMGFEIADVKSGKVIHRVEVTGFGWPDQITCAPHKGPLIAGLECTKLTSTGIRESVRLGHGTPSHGVSLAPDEKEIWVADDANRHVHIFDATVMPPKQMMGKSIKVRNAVGWITTGLDGKYIYPASGDVIDAAAKKVVGGFFDENGRAVGSEKLLEIAFVDGKPVRAVDQFGKGMISRTTSSQD